MRVRDVPMYTLFGELIMNSVASEVAVPTESLLFQFTSCQSSVNALLVKKSEVARASVVLVAFFSTGGGVESAPFIFR